VTTYEAEYADLKLKGWGDRLKRLGRRMRDGAMIAAVAAGHEFRKGVPVARQHIADHGYSIIGLGLFDAAMFTHSVFTGLLVSGLSFLAFEWKVEGSSGVAWQSPL
jgi:hypothetical protein